MTTPKAAARRDRRRRHRASTTTASPTARARPRWRGFLLDNGCDGLNVLGTTGEATSFSIDQRQRVMSAYAASGLPLDRA